MSASSDRFGAFYALIINRFQLDPDDNIYTSEDWKEVKGKTKALREDKRALPSALSPKMIYSPPTQSARPTTFRVTIHVCPIEDASNHIFHVLMTRNLSKIHFCISDQGD